MLPLPINETIVCSWRSIGKKCSSICFASVEGEEEMDQVRAETTGKKKASGGLGRDTTNSHFYNFEGPSSKKMSQGVAASATEEIPTVAAIEADLKELLGEKAEAEAAATAEGEEKK
ncbi:hypothetical protein Tco_1029478 [Tanacetum coccineum]|uniref:Uncharacterized protein n=1 Tax=Tanacetum coccineum TaxID=301880 RepID=A0ABQ5G5S3_9ASTR